MQTTDEKNIQLIPIHKLDIHFKIKYGVKIFNKKNILMIN